jgi:protein-tyrosine phosphatase
MFERFVLLFGSTESVESVELSSDRETISVRWFLPLDLAIPNSRGFAEGFTIASLNRDLTSVSLTAARSMTLWSDGSRAPRVLFVCLGNIIRSPLCEGLLRYRVLPSVQVDSAASTYDDIGQHPNQHAQKVAKKHGFDISSHIARLVTTEDFTKFDILVSLEESVYRDLERMKPRGSKAIVCEFVPGQDISNPWYAGYREFESMYVEIEEGMPPFMEKYIPQKYRK